MHSRAPCCFPPFPVSPFQETKWDYEQLNTVKPLWTRSPKDITDEEYIQFYKDAFKQYQVRFAVKREGD